MATKASRGRSKSASSGDDVYSLLKEDHQKVQKMFQQFEKLHENDGDSDEMHEIAQQICAELTIHAQVEEELFYPALRESFEEPDLIDEAKVEHDSARMLIDMIQQEDGDEDAEKGVAHRRRGASSPRVISGCCPRGSAAPCPPGRPWR